MPLFEDNIHHTTYVDEKFFKALKEFDGTIEALSVGTYLAMIKSDGKNFVYDPVVEKVMPEEEWDQNTPVSTECLEQIFALEKAGLKSSLKAVIEWLEGHEKIFTTTTGVWCASDERGCLFLSERNLKYGFRVIGYKKREEGDLWEIELYDRTSETGDHVRGIDSAYLLYDADGRVWNAVLDLEDVGNGVLSFSKPIKLDGV